MIGILGGTGFHRTDFLGGAEEVEIETFHGQVSALVGRDYLFVHRHGPDRKALPHLINHKANIMAYKEKGVKEILSITSVGSLREEIPPKALVVPHDYMQLTGIPTFFETEIAHVTPGLDADLRNRIISAAKRLGISVITEGVYFQAAGPRLETRAEINFIRDYADVVGMTMASEATLARELGIKYATISTVDNYAHGVAGAVPDFDGIAKSASEEREELKRIVKEVVEASK
jgi:5'-methylthioadenosine phosphorylase